MPALYDVNTLLVVPNDDLRVKELPAFLERIRKVPGVLKAEFNLNSSFIKPAIEVTCDDREAVRERLTGFGSTWSFTHVEKSTK